MLLHRLEKKTIPLGARRLTTRLWKCHPNKQLKDQILAMPEHKTKLR